MFKYVLSLTFATVFATAAPMSIASATCDGITTSSTGGAFCNDGRFMASASASPRSVSVDAGFLSLMSGGGGADASFTDDYVFTVTGGTGDGFFYPCFSGRASVDGLGEGFFGGIYEYVQGINCSRPVPHAIPFTFGVPKIVHYSIGASASPSFHRGEENVVLSFDGILFFDPSGNPLPNVTYTLVSTPVPEPSALALLSVGLMLLLLVRRIKLAA
jgi:hypothetical protein